ncbi:MAG: hypothetical protein Q9195_008139 [Heterodermia aff. obscurata]
MKLPAEVRNMIYEYCLVVKGCITPYKGKYTRVTDQDHTSHDFTVGLLAVDKTVRSEAAAIFYGKNIWRITVLESYLAIDPDSDLDMDPHIDSDIDVDNSPSSNTDRNSRLIWNIHKALFRRVLIRADRYDTVGFDRPNIGSSRMRVNHKKSLAERMNNAHLDNFELMHDCFDSQFRIVWDMPNLVSVTFDVSSLLCLNGCCRLEALRELFVFFTECWDDCLRNTDHIALEYLKAAYVVGLNSPLEEAQTNRAGSYVPSVPWVILTEKRLIGDDESSENQSETESETVSEEDYWPAPRVVENEDSDDD